ncbi:SUN domain-containing protein 4-like isoform X2 [Amaranthus tricolor]|uniref:SUN domain-containing protein 4-like isoform X2 n=1 Tax=Amaranthus tricolor TaxID=29722 RepID=UPI00258690EE|nr:SUN domain-containing protein 4-like isoform X2 [Amaranthus tricolor]XP_057533742.1 SUN domain-containing protein 4-like isoform X2 [Amaranthus tricolor]
MNQMNRQFPSISTLLHLFIILPLLYDYKSEAPAFNVSNFDENKQGSDLASGPVHNNELALLEDKHLNETCAENSYETSCTDDNVTKALAGEFHSGEDTGNHTKTDVLGSVDHAEVQTGVDRSSITTGILGSTESFEVEGSNFDEEKKKGNGKTERLSRTVPRGLEEFKKKALNSSSTNVSGATGNVIHRMEPGGGEYNYASAAKGAKVLDSNKEAKGASNILNKDKDKYLRNPCSAEGKFVVIELSEETLVDMIEIANFEHYSSNLKDFELLGSQVYPTQTWEKLGNFSAGNVKHAQRFALSVPKWVRYLKLNILSHYGSEFYCTLSSVEVYGVDAVERMLEDLINVPDHHRYENKEPAVDQEPTAHVAESAESGTNQDNPFENETAEGKNLKHNEAIDGSPDHVEEVRHQVSRMPGDTVLKILMQKVRTLDLSLSVLERYLEEVNSRYTNIFKEFDNDLEEKEWLLEKTRLDLKNVLDSKDVIAKDVDDLVAWRSLVSVQLDAVLKDNAILRSDIRKVQERQFHMESKGIVVFLISVVFGFVSLFMLFTDMVNSVYKSEKSRKFCLKSSWFFLFLSCTSTIVVLSL